MLAEVNQRLGPIFQDLAGSGESLRVAYRSTACDPLPSASGACARPSAAAPTDELLACFRGRQARLASREVEQAVSLVGPHRDDFGFLLDGVDLNTFGSRGQQRLLVLALRLAEVLPVTEAAGTAPVLLLDDALSELDPGVRDNVLREIQSAEQVFLTSPEPLAVSGATRWIVDGGGIAAA
jgi:DNA replication and repair protein RecF